MNKITHANPCPACHTKMTVKKTSSMGQKGHRHWYYFLFCKNCGYGPLHAYDSETEAIQQWNHYIVLNNNMHSPRFFNRH